MKGITERILIKNFFSIKEINWEIKDFNVLTGGMAAGKSLCIKLVYFLEHILHRNIFFSAISRETLKREVFYENMSKQFKNLFHSENPENDLCNTEIKYTFVVSENNMVFDLTAKWNKDTKNLEWTSNYIDTHIDIWCGFIDEKDTNTGDVRKKIDETISREFLTKFPITTRFIPASRAIASIIKNTAKKDIMDAFLLDFIQYTKNSVSSFYNVSDINDYKININKLLQINKMLIYHDQQSDEDIISIEASGGRKITPLELSSGQQELLYFLLLIKDISAMTSFHDEKNNLVLIFNNNLSVFIEEPSSHLFPQEQKDIIEFIAQIFRILTDKKKINTRFFITTHSPYVLNVINNMLTKGDIMERNEVLIKRINKKIKFPHIYKDELSAIFIKKNGKHKNMLNGDEKVMFADDIAEISFSINDDTNKLDDLNNYLIHEKELNNVL